MHLRTQAWFELSMPSQNMQIKAMLPNCNLYFQFCFSECYYFTLNIYILFSFRLPHLLFFFLPTHLGFFCFCIWFQKVIKAYIIKEVQNGNLVFGLPEFNMTACSSPSYEERLSNWDNLGCNLLQLKVPQNMESGV